MSSSLYHKILHKTLTESDLKGNDVDVNFVDKTNKGNTPLNEACARGYLKMVKLLLSASNINVNKANDKGNTPLHSVVLKYFDPDDLSIVSLLLNRPDININAKNNDDHTPLVSAFKQADEYASGDKEHHDFESNLIGIFEIIDLLLADKRVDVNPLQRYEPVNESIAEKISNVLPPEYTLVEYAGPYKPPKQSNIFRSLKKSLKKSLRRSPPRYDNEPPPYHDGGKSRKTKKSRRKTKKSRRKTKNSPCKY
jgi:hypothetical protein